MIKIKETISSEFDAFSKDYTTDMVFCVPFYNELIDCFTKDLPKDFRPIKILDVGCGNGNASSKLIQLFPKANFTLVDASAEMLNLCKTRFKENNITCVKSYFQDFEFGENQYDLVLAGFSLHHCNSIDKQKIFKGIYKSLKKNGIFKCSDLMINKKKREHSSLITYWKAHVLSNYVTNEKWEWLMEHYHEFDNPDELKDQKLWLKQAGFKAIELISYQNYWNHITAIK